jgi:hypothetical protein
MCGCMYVSKTFMRILLVILAIALLASAGCMSCLPKYAAPPHGPVSSCYPVGHDPFVPMDHNVSALNPWDLLASMTQMFLYGPPR